jgi:hypothetical protein
MIAIAPLFKGTLPAHNALAGKKKRQDDGKHE